MGSFFNVLSDRLSYDETITGRSHCDKCKHTLAALDLVPLFSFLFLGGKCRYCKHKLSWYYPLTEFVTGVSFVLTWMYAPVMTDLERSIYIVIVSCLIVIFFADIKYQIIPDEMQITLFIAAFALFIAQGFSCELLGWKLLAAVVVMLPILGLFLVTKGRGMGFGDVKLALSIGFLHGIKSGLLVLYLGFISGAIIGLIVMALKQKKLRSKIAFGPFLIFGMVVMLFYPQPLLDLLMRFYGI